MALHPAVSAFTDFSDSELGNELSAAPSLAWRASFLRPPARLTSTTYTPEIGRLGLNGAMVHFRTAPHRLRFRLRRIDRWVQYANTVLAFSPTVRRT
jgi:hypothetical protein